MRQQLIRKPVPKPAPETWTCAHRRADPSRTDGSPGFRPYPGPTGRDSAGGRRRAAQERRLVGGVPDRRAGLPLALVP